MIYPFKVECKYSRRDVFRIIGIPEDTKGGDWFTGYTRHKNDWFIFCNVGTPGNTGHDYKNYWKVNKLLWYGKKTSKLETIKSMSEINSNTYIFWRDNKKAQFTFAGIAFAEKIFENDTPVKILWSFQTKIFPNEIEPGHQLKEGAVTKVSVNSYERNPIARQKCLEHYGFNCFVCNFDFRKFYGELGKGFIHVHHLKPISEIGQEYIIQSMIYVLYILIVMQ